MNLIFYLRGSAGGGRSKSSFGAGRLELRAVIGIDLRAGQNDVCNSQATSTDEEHYYT